MSESMVERVARAIASELERASDIPDDVAFAYLGTARAAIAAMREPTEHQLRAAWEKAHCNIDDFWREFIDAALSEPKGG